MSELAPCPTCDGSCEVLFNHGPRYAGGPDPQCDDWAVCPDCKGDGTQIRGDLELLADLAATHSADAAREVEVRADERRQIVLVLRALKYTGAADLIEAGFRDPDFTP